MKRVIVIGAGAAGLAAAEALAGNDVEVLLLEARERIGGRIYTIYNPTGSLPIELGAEFIHGASNLTWPFIRRAGLQTMEVPDRHWGPSSNGLLERGDFWDKLSRVFSRLDRAAPDRSFREFLEQLRDVPEQEKALARDFVEGFHAAETELIGTHALAQAEAAAQQEEGTRQFRLVPGYGALLAWFDKRLKEKGVKVLLNADVRSIHWKRGEVGVRARRAQGEELFTGDAAIITLPLGVLRSGSPGARVAFEPGIPSREAALEALRVGSVSKLVLEFRECFWPEKDFGFLHVAGAAVPTWWSDSRGPVLTGWAGGPQATGLLAGGENELLRVALTVLAQAFRIRPGELERLLVANYRYDWDCDPFACGAYSYVPVGMLHMSQQLAQPVEETLFFAGEATDQQGDNGTVHGALGSGVRAAGEALDRLVSSGR